MTINVNLAGVPTNNVLPSGTYHARITATEVRKGPKAEYINVEYTVISLVENDEATGKYAGRKVWENVSLAANALFSLKSLAKAVGLDTEGALSFEVSDLLDHDLLVKVGVRDATDEYEAQNVVRTHKAI